MHHPVYIDYSKPPHQYNFSSTAPSVTLEHSSRSCARKAQEHTVTRCMRPRIATQRKKTRMYHLRVSLLATFPPSPLTVGHLVASVSSALPSLGRCRRRKMREQSSPFAICRQHAVGTGVRSAYARVSAVVCAHRSLLSPLATGDVVWVRRIAATAESAEPGVREDS